MPPALWISTLDTIYHHTQLRGGSVCEWVSLCHLSHVPCLVTTGAGTTVHCGPRPTELGAVLACAGCCPRTGLPGLGWAGLGWWWYLLVQATGGLAGAVSVAHTGVLLLSSEERRP